MDRRNHRYWIFLDAGKRPTAPNDWRSRPAVETTVVEEEAEGRFDDVAEPGAQTGTTG